MTSVADKLSALSPEMTTQLRQLWQQALADKTPGLPPDQVFDALESKYQAITNQPPPIR